MDTKTLYLEIFQPFAQYRNLFTFYYAQTFPLPPPSTIIGMLQNATGRYYDTEFWDLKVSIHGGFESVFWNYQQLIKGGTELSKKDGKIVLLNQNLPLYGNGLTSQRSPVYQQELFNGHLFIFIRGKEALIDEIHGALKNPRKILYLGRSEDVIFIKDIKEVHSEKKTVKRNIWMSYPTYIQEQKERKFPIKNVKYPVYSIPLKTVFKNKEIPIKNKSEITKGTDRETEFGSVIYTGYDYSIYLNDKVEVERIDVNGNKFKIPVEWGWLHA